MVLATSMLRSHYEAAIARATIALRAQLFPDLCRPVVKRALRRPRLVEFVERACVLLANPGIDGSKQALVAHRVHRLALAAQRHDLRLHAHPDLFLVNGAAVSDVIASLAFSLEDESVLCLSDSILWPQNVESMNERGMAHAMRHPPRV